MTTIEDERVTVITDVNMKPLFCKAWSKKVNRAGKRVPDDLHLAFMFRMLEMEEIGWWRGKNGRVNFHVAYNNGVYFELAKTKKKINLYGDEVGTDPGTNFVRWKTKTTVDIEPYFGDGSYILRLPMVKVKAGYIKEADRIRIYFPKFTRAPVRR
jgi:hypothetical protein